MTPEGNVAEVECVPPGIEHGGVEMKDAFACYSWRGRDQCGEAVVHGGALGDGDAGKKVPQREGVALARFAQHGVERGLASGKVHGQIKLGECRAESIGGVFEIGSSWAGLRVCGAGGTRRDEGFAAVAMEPHPAECGT